MVEDITAEISLRLQAQAKRMECCQHYPYSLGADAIEQRDLQVFAVLGPTSDSARNAEWHPDFEAGLRHKIHPELKNTLDWNRNALWFNHYLAARLAADPEVRAFSLTCDLLHVDNYQLTYLAVQPSVDLSALGSRYNTEQLWREFLRIIRTDAQIYWPRSA